jgi:hypothetical protein
MGIFGILTDGAKPKAETPSHQPPIGADGKPKRICCSCPDTKVSITASSQDACSRNVVRYCLLVLGSNFRHDHYLQKLRDACIAERGKISELMTRMSAKS